MGRDRGKPILDLTGLICFFCKKMDSVLKISLSIEYHTKSDPPLSSNFLQHRNFRLPPPQNIPTSNMDGPKDEKCQSSQINEAKYFP